MHTNKWAIISGVFVLMLSFTLRAESPPRSQVVTKKIIEVPSSSPAPLPAETEQTATIPEPKTTVSVESPGEIEKLDSTKPEPSTPIRMSDTALKKLSGEDIPLYDPMGKIDPFSPLIKRKTEKPEPKKIIKKRIPRTPLEKMDFSQMKLVAIIQSSKGNKALVEESGGKGYIISTGTYMGLNSGRVIQILKDRIVIEESIENVLGKVETKQRELTLQKPPGEF